MESFSRKHLFVRFVGAVGRRKGSSDSFKYCNPAPVSTLRNINVQLLYCRVPGLDWIGTYRGNLWLLINDCICRTIAPYPWHGIPTDEFCGFWPGWKFWRKLSFPLIFVILNQGKLVLLERKKALSGSFQLFLKSEKRGLCECNGGESM